MSEPGSSALIMEETRRLLQRQEADLDTLASSLGISRSAMNHRLRRLVELAAESTIASRTRS